MSDNQETVKIHKMIGGKLYPLELKRNRFEQTIDRIDRAVQHGATIRDIHRKFEMHIVGKGPGVEDFAASKTASTGAAASVGGTPAIASSSKTDKAAIVAATIKEFPHLSVGEIAKKVAAHHDMTVANARYLASKIMK